MVSMQNIGETIKALRENAGYNQLSLANFLKVDQSLISKIEKGERNISSDMLEKLAALFGVSAESIINANSAVRPLSCAFRSSDLTVDEMEAICAINKIALNSEFMYSVLEARKL